MLHRFLFESISWKLRIHLFIAGIIKVWKSFYIVCVKIDIVFNYGNEYFTNNNVNV